MREHYQQAVRTRLREAWGQNANSSSSNFRQGAGDDFRHRPRQSSRFGAASGNPGQGGRRSGSASNAGGARPTVSNSLRQSALASPKQQHIAPYREALLIAAVLNHPWLLEEQAEEIASIDFATPVLGRLRSMSLSLDLTGKSLDTVYLRSHLLGLDLAKAVELVDRGLMIT